MTNVDAVDHWSGEVGDHWASEAERYDRMNADTAERIIRAVAPQPGQRILDVGCGSGALAPGIAPSVEPGGEVVGLDLSRQMLGVARARATERQLTNVTFHHGDAQTHDLGMRRFDSIVSRFGVMFFSDPAAAFANLAGALRPSGRLIFSCWQDLARNEWVTVPAAAALEHVPIPAGLTEVGAHGAFSLSDPQAITDLLDGAALPMSRLPGSTSRCGSDHPSRTPLLSCAPPSSPRCCSPGPSARRPRRDGTPLLRCSPSTARLPASSCKAPYGSSPRLAPSCRSHPRSSGRAP